jgi:ATP-binding cassette subfamily B protein
MATTSRDDLGSQPVPRELGRSGRGRLIAQPVPERDAHPVSIVSLHPVSPSSIPTIPSEGGWIRRLSPFLLAHRRNVVIALAGAVVGQGLAALTPVFAAVIVDDGISSDTRAVWPWLVALVASGLASFGCAYVRRWVGGRVALDVQFDLRNAIYERLQRLDFAGHDQLRTGQLVSRASTDLGLVQGLLSFLPILLGNFVLLVVALVVMVILSPLLTLVVVAMLPILLVTSLRLRGKVFPATWDAQQRAGEVAGVVDEAVTGVRVVKGFGQEERELDHLAGVAEGLYASRARLVRLQARYTSTLQAIPTLAQVLVLALGGWLAINGRLSLGAFLAFSSYLVQLLAPVRLLAGLFTVGQQARAGAERILDILDANAQVADGPDAHPLEAVRGEVRFEGVRFGYTRREPVLDDLDLVVAAGEVVALVGTSGSGKSTITALLPRFYDVAEGRVTVDGHDVRDVTLESLRRQVGVVFEDAFLFSDTIRANIAYGCPDASEAEIEAAAAAAGAAAFIGALPGGYGTVVGERGVTLSGGQRQRLALARAILTDPRILVLDDATSAVDATTEEAIHATLRELMADRTTILIAHRRSTLRLAQRIVVLDAGRVVAEGTHEELLVSSPIYRDLFAGPDDVDLTVGEEDLDGEGIGVVEGITTSAWPVLDDSGPVAALALGGAPAIGPPGGGGGMTGPSAGVSLTATPEMLATLATLPPADDTPDVDLDAVTAPDPEPFRIRRFARPWMRWFVLGFGLVALDTVLTLMGPALIRRGLDDGVSAGSESGLWTAVVVFAVVALVDWAVVWAYTLVTGRTAERALFALRVKIFGHLQRLSLRFYDTELDGRIMTKMTTDVEALSQLVQIGLINGVVGILTCIGVFVFLLVLSPPLAAVTAAILPPLLLATLWYRRRSSRAYAQAREAIADVNANFQESLSGVRVSQAYVREGRNIVGFRSVNRRYLDHRLEAQRLVAVYFPFVLFLSDLATALVLGAGAAFEDRGIVTAGTVIAFVLYLNQFFSPIQQLSQVLDTWQQATASVEKISELLDTEEDTPLPADPEPVGRLRGAIELRDVHFAYDGSAEGEALSGIDLDVAPGETLALVGETGAGKSTLVKLVARFYDPTSGRVLIDGHDLRHVDLAGVRHQLGVVPQEAFLFTGTVRDNIAYGRPTATDLEVEAAARAVGAHDFIASLPAGYRTPVSERGRSLSSGQRQLIALARARLVDPAILLLDEATSQLDLASEGRVQRAMDAAASGRTTILVAHRLPTARRADRIVVIDGGRVAEQGTHDELIARDGRYAELWQAFASTGGETGAAVPSAG